jgi:predicted dehydrogenase
MPSSGESPLKGENVKVANIGVIGTVNVMAAPHQSPHLTSVPLTYTTKSGEVVETRKQLQPEPSFLLSETEDAPAVGVAILGYRRFGRKHLKDVFVNKACKVRFIVEYTKELADQAKIDVQNMGLENCQVVSDPSKLEAICNDKAIKVVIVSSLMERKIIFVSTALKAGKTVLCDRPLATNTEDVKQLFDLARQSKAILLSNLPGRPGKAFTPVIMSLISSASVIKINRLSAANGTCDFSKCPPIDINSEDTSAMILDVAMHDVSAINFCMCMRPTEVSAKISDANKSVCVVSLTYPNGCKVEVSAAIGQESFDAQQFTVYGERLSDMRRVDHMNTCDMKSHGNSTNGMDGDGQQRAIRFTQVYDKAGQDALEQAYAFSAGHQELALRVRPHLMEQNCCDNMVVKDAALASLLDGGKSVHTKYW